MAEIIVSPYEAIERQTFIGASKIDLKAAMFENVEHRDGRMVISFIDCNFLGKLEIVNTEEIVFNEISVYFYGCYIPEISVNQIVSTNISISFGSSIISGKIESSNLLDVSMNNTLVNSSIFLLKVNRVHISFSEENIYPRIWTRLLRLTIFKSFDALFRLDKSYYLYDIQEILFENRHRPSNLDSGYYFRPHSPGDGHLGYYLKEGKKKSLNINLSVQNTSVDGSKNIKVISSYLQSLTIKGYTSGNVSVENCKIQELYLREFSGAKEASFYSLEPLYYGTKDSLIEFHKCRFDGTWFDNVKFGSFDVVSFFRSKLAKATFTSCTFPKDFTTFEKFKTLPNVHYPDELSENYYKDQYETYLQLRSALDSSGNFYEAQKLQAISNEALRKITDVSFFDKLILHFNSWSNSHGLSIVKPFTLFFIVSIIFYVGYLWTLGRMFNSNGVDYSLFAMYFSFIDITHKNDFLVSRGQLNFWSQLIDFAGKIFLGYFIFQFVAAFRKYGRK